MNLPNMVSISKVSADIGKLLKTGGRYLILKNSEPVGAIVTVEDFQKLSLLDDIEMPEEEVVA